jgi:hypothetical protein
MLLCWYRVDSAISPREEPALILHIVCIIVFSTLEG